MFLTSDYQYTVEARSNCLVTYFRNQPIVIKDLYPLTIGCEVLIKGTKQGHPNDEIAWLTTPLVSFEEGTTFKVCTKHTIYTFMVKNGCLQTICGHYAIAVTELHGLVTGERLRVKGRRLSPMGEVDCEFITSPIVEIRS